MSMTLAEEPKHRNMPQEQEESNKHLSLFCERSFLSIQLLAKP